jgi:ADP-dependent NAD(P)H-hydrate dehydratase
MKTITQIPTLQPRPVDGHKGLFGKILIVGGSVGFSGAPALAGKAALRSGAGLVRLAVPQSILPIVASLEPCYTTIPLGEDADGKITSDAAAILAEHAKQNDVVAFGPGIGVSAGVKDVLLHLLGIEGLKIVIDADGLNTLALCGGALGWAKKKKASVILTPHPGEMQRLWKSLFRGKLPEGRIEQAAELAEQTGTTVVLKGAGTVVADGKKVYVNTTGNAGMATAGAGDVLTGVIAALAGQGLSLMDAAVAGVYIHGLAGDLAAKEKGQIGLIATDILDALPQALMKAEKGKRHNRIF